MLVYNNLLDAMKEEKITFRQISELLDCRYQTVSSIVNGSTKKGFYYEDACKIHEVYFSKYNQEWLFIRYNTLPEKELMFDKDNISL